MGAGQRDPRDGARQPVRRHGCGPAPRRAVRPGAARACAATLAAALMAGCASAPVAERPVPPVPAAFPATTELAAAAGSPRSTGTPAADATSAAAVAWADFVTDARTQTLVRQALATNRDLRIAVANVERARALLGVVRADALPGVGVGAQVARSSASDSYSVGMMLANYELDLFGRVRSLSDAAAARLAASDEARRAAELSLIAAVVDTELALRADDALVALTEHVLASREATLKLVRIKFDGGAAGAPELHVNESLVAAARAQHAALRRQRAQRTNALVLLVGGALPADLPPPRALADHVFAELPAGLPSEVLLQRPDVCQAESQLAAAEADIGAARAAMFPRITLTGSIGTASSELSGLFSNAAWSFAGQLLQPLFDAGRNRAALAAAQAARDAAIAQYEKAIQSAFREVADALAARATWAAQLDAQRAQARAEAQRLALVEMMLSHGAASALERLDAERARLAAEQAALQTELALRHSAVLLYRVLGGGTQRPDVAGAAQGTAAGAR